MRRLNGWYFAPRRPGQNPVASSFPVPLSPDDLDVIMHELSCCSHELDAVSGPCQSQSYVQRSSDAVPLTDDRAGGESSGALEIDRLREELDHARQQIDALQLQRRDLEGMVIDLSIRLSSDELTGLRNQNRFKEDLESACTFASRQNLILSLIVLDLDDFASYNIAFGEPAGDEVLRTLAGILTSMTRAYDVVARQGAGTFAVLLPSTDRFDACQIADRLRMSLAAHDWPSRPITASFGVATRESSVFCATELLDQARLALGQAKHEGQNRVVHFTEVRNHPLGNGERSRICRPKFECSALD
jgi:diguanylate cyclase (GGDEF)-like protein